MRRDADGTTETLDAVDATEADASVAMRLALMSGFAGLDDAESEVGEATAEELAEVAEAIAMRIALLADVTGPDAVESDAAEPDAPEQDAAGLSRELVTAEEQAEAEEAAQEVIDEFEAAEFLAGHQAAQQGRLAAQEAETAARLVPAARSRYARGDDEDASEAEAEAQALREALEIVLGGEENGPHRLVDAPAGEAPAAAASVADVQTVESPAVDARALEVPVVEVPVVDTSKGEVSSEVGAKSGEARKKGLFRRFRGN
jgi:hypothetical protein